MNFNAYIDIAQRIKDLVPAVKHVDLFNEQYNNPEKEIPFNTPAVFMEFAPTPWSGTTNGVQEGTGAIRIHIVFDFFGSSHNVTSLNPTQQQQLFTHYNVSKQVHRILEGYQPSNCTQLRRVLSSPDHNHDQLLIEVMEYACMEYDNSADVFQDFVDSPINDITFNEELTYSTLEEYLNSSEAAFIVHAINHSNKEQQIKDALCGVFSNAQVKVNGNNFANAGSGDVVDVPVINSGNAPVGTINTGNVNIADSVVNAKDSAGAIKQTVSVPAENNIDITIADATVDIMNANGVTLHLVHPKAEEVISQVIADSHITANGNALADVHAESNLDVHVKNAAGAAVGSIIAGEVIIPDAVERTKNSAGTILHTNNIHPGVTHDTTVTDSVVNVKNSAAATLSTTNVPAETIGNITMPDKALTINGAAFDALVAGTDKNVVVKDGGGTPVGSKVGSEWIVEAPARQITLNFAAGSDNKIIINSDYAGVISATIDTNITTKVFKLNGTTVTLPFTVAIDDVIEITITRSNSALSSAIVISKGTYAQLNTSATLPDMGGNGRYAYILNMPDHTLSVIDLSTWSVIATISLNATYTQGSISYRAVNNSVYIFGHTTANTLTVEIVNCSTNAVTYSNTYAITDIGYVCLASCYNYIDDVFHVAGQGGAECPLVVFKPTTNTVISSISRNITAVNNMYYIGYAYGISNTFYLGQSIGIGLSPISGSNFSKYKCTIGVGRTGTAGIVFNRNDNFIYLTDFNGGTVKYYPYSTYPNAPSPYSFSGTASRSLCHAYLQDKIFGANPTALAISTNASNITISAIGAETGFKSIEYSEFADRVLVLTRGGNTLRVINPNTNALDATHPYITVGNQNTLSTAGFNQLCFNRLKLF